MKKLLILIFLLPASIGFGQKVNFSVNAGVNYSFLEFIERGEPNGYSQLNADYDGKTGIELSTRATMPINNSLAFSTGIGLSMNRYDVKYYRFGTYTCNLYNLELPILLNIYFLNKRLVASGGIGLDYLMDARTNDRSFKDKWPPFYTNFILDIKYKALEKIGIGVSYRRNITLLEKYEDYNTYVTTYHLELKINTIALYVSYDF